MGVRERRAWAKRVVAQMCSDMPDADRIVVLAGERYREFLLPYLQTRATHIELPLEGKRIGEQL
jgi:hypothetical protein